VEEGGDADAFFDGGVLVVAGELLALGVVVGLF